MRFSRSTEPKAVPLAVAMLTLFLGVLLAADAGATIDFTFIIVNPVRIGQTGIDYQRFKCAVTNTGTQTDFYDVLRIRQDLPTGWETSVCLGRADGGCYAPFVDSVYAGTPPCGFPSCAGNSNYDLAPGETDTVSCYFTPNGPEGSGYAALRVRSVTTPSLFRDVTVGCVTTGVDVLVMDDDGGAGLESYYLTAVPGGQDKGVWDRSIDGTTSAELLTFPKVVWFTGSAIPTLDASDRTAIAGYLTGGGKLLLSGQDIAFDLCDPASPNYSAANVTWYETNLKTRYLNNNSNSLNLNGVAGDPISNGLNLAIQGGDGASNQTDPDVLQPRAGAGTVWTYVTGGGTAGTRILGGGYRGVDLGFGFEAISSAANRSTVMTNILNWLGASAVSVDEDDVAVVPGATLGPVHPNPFAPSTAINFELKQAGVVRLRILDAAGRAIRLLAAEPLAIGRHVRLWDGRDARGKAAAAGVYLAELSVEGTAKAERVKLTLLR